MNSVLGLLGVAAKLELMQELMASNMRMDAKKRLEEKPSISLSFYYGSRGVGYACRG